MPVELGRTGDDIIGRQQFKDKRLQAVYDQRNNNNVVFGH